MNAPHVELIGATDVGRVREVNEDDYFVGQSVVAVADGMGGHLAGEVASKTALEPIRTLDGKIFDDAPAAVEALRDAVVRANETVSKLAADEPNYRGMGTTLTAAMLEGRRLHLAHVGDSRAYLLRAASFSQLTDDHTLVQHLVDEGQITPEEAAQHPQRSIVTRAIGVSRDVDVDALSLDLEPGDQVLLCSDGLSGVLSDQQIAELLLAGEDGEQTLDLLIEAANDGGGTDNITAVLLRYGKPATAAAAGADDPVEEEPPPTGAAAPVRIGTRTERDDGDWAGRLGNYGALSPSGGRAFSGLDDGGGRSVGRTLGRIVAVLLGVAVLAGLAMLGGRFLLDRSYYVGLDGDDVVIYQGVNVDLGPVSLSRVRERTGVTVDELPTWYAQQLADGRPAADLDDARRIVEGAPRRDETGGDTTDDTAGDP